MSYFLSLSSRREPNFI